MTRILLTSSLDTLFNAIALGHHQDLIPVLLYLFHRLEQRLDGTTLLLIDEAWLMLFRARFGAPTALVAAGGVAANQAIRKVLNRLAFEVGATLVVPPPELCTDNGAMIAWAGCERLALGLTDPLDTAPRARWPLDEIAAAEGALRRTAAYK